MDFETASYAIRKAKQYANSQRLAYENPKHADFVWLKNDEPDIVAPGFNFFLKSPLLPTKEELAYGDISLGNLEGDLVFDGLTISNPVFDSDAIYGGNLYNGESRTNTLLIVVYEVGDYTASVSGVNITVSVPQTGIYVGTSSSSSRDDIALDIKWSEVKQIDPKFIPAYDNRINILDYGVSDPASPIIVEQGTAFWNRLLEIRNAGVTPEVQVVSSNYGPASAISGWQYNGGAEPYACSAAGKTLIGGELTDVYLIMQYDESAGTVTVLHNMS